MKKCQRQTSSWGRLTGQRGWDVNTDYCFHVCLSFPLNCARLQTAFFSSFSLIYCVLFLYSRDISLLYCCAIPSLFPFVKFPLITLSIRRWTIAPRSLFTLSFLSLWPLDHFHLFSCQSIPNHCLQSSWFLLWFSTKAWSPHICRSFSFDQIKTWWLCAFGHAGFWKRKIFSTLFI